MTSTPNATTLELSAALTPNDRTAALADGRVQPEGLHLLVTKVHASEMFWRQLKFAEFDISEMSLSSLMIATSHGPTDWVAIPVFTMRNFFHTGILVRADAGIAQPGDLRGKRVGVPEYQQTSALWSRGILHDEYGIEPRDITWFMERPPEQSHGGSTGFVPPPGVRLEYIPRETNIGEMLLTGKLDATLLYLNTSNLVDRSRADLHGRSDIRTLFPDPAAEARRYYAATGIYPINHTVVIRRTLLERYPWIALNMFRAFVAVKELLAEQRKRLLEPYVNAGMLDDAALAALRRDPLAYGIKEPRPVLDTIARYLHEQGLTPRLVKLDEVFAPSCMDL